MPETWTPPGTPSGFPVDPMENGHQVLKRTVTGWVPTVTLPRNG
jgi:hypothetical protein